jgi:PEGA domain
LSDAARTEQAAKRLTARLDEQILKSAPSPSTAQTQPEAPAPVQVPEPRVRVETPERRTPVAAATGELSVASAPDGAKIEVDGQSGRNWVTPQVFASLLPGNHTVTVSKTGYSTEIRNIDVLRGRRALLQVKLSPTRGMLNIAGKPAGARIFVNGKDTGRVTPAEIVLDPGSNSIRVHKDGYLDSSTSVSIRAGETLSLSPSLTMAGRTDTIKVVGGIGKMFGGSGDMGRMQIKSSPRGASVTINQMRLEKPTPVSIQLDPGTYEITLEMLGYRPLRKVVVVGAGQKLEIDENLSKY